MALFVVDGTFELFRCFHAAPRATGSDGREVGAARGVLWTLVALLHTPELTHVAVALDRMPPPKPADRGPDALLKGQSALMADIVRALGIPLWSMTRFQADDALATAAARYKAEVDQVVLCTTDKDLAQCVDGTRVVLLDRIRKITRDEDGVRAKWGVDPRSIPDLLGLVGDPADGLPGIPGWGSKSAATVLTRYPHLEDIPPDPADWEVAVRGAARLAASLQARRLEALLYRNLAILRQDLPIPHTLTDLEWRGAHREQLEPLADLLDDHSALDAVPRWALPVSP